MTTFNSGDKVRLRKTDEVNDKQMIFALNARKIFHDKIYIVKTMHSSYQAGVTLQAGLTLEEFGSFYAHFFELVSVKTVGFVIED